MSVDQVFWPAPGEFVARDFQPPRTDAGLPQYAPEVWNDLGPIQGSTNCYAYACDGTWRWQTPLAPGELSGAPFYQGVQEQLQRAPQRAHEILAYYYSPDVLRAAAVRDGLSETPLDAGYAVHIRVGLCVAGGQLSYDFHIVRQDAHGQWSHKLGFGPVRNTDASGRVIEDPEVADWDYSEEPGVHTAYELSAGYLWAPARR